ncbi:MAG: glycosyltransferase [Pseudomonadales bacterium]
MKIYLINQSLSGGGAAIACRRLYRALQSEGVDVSMISSGREAGWFFWFKSIVGRLIDKLVLILMRTTNKTHHSLSLFGSGIGNTKAIANADLVHLHWINNGCMSIWDIRKMARTKPVVWTLHDMWAFCGAEHYIGEFDDKRYQLGYSRFNRNHGESGLDVNRWIWNLKKHVIPKNIVYVTPSHWLASEVKKSALLNGCRVEVIPNAIDTDYWAPGDKRTVRQAFGISSEEYTLLFSSASGYREWRKGEDLLAEVIATIKTRSNKKIVAIVVGGDSDFLGEDTDSFRTISVGFLHSSDDIKKWYQAADIVIVPSRLDNFPNVALEAMACGVPCCAFDSGGIVEAVDNGRNGIIAAREDANGMAEKILDLIESEDKLKDMALNAREKVVRDYSPDKIAACHANLYNELVLNR